VRASIPGQATTAAYPHVVNGNAKGCEITGVSSSVADKVEIHEHQHSGGTMRMRQLERLTIAAGEDEMFAPSGLHLMVMGLHNPLREGDTVTFDFTSDSCGNFSASLPVRRI